MSRSSINVPMGCQFQWATLKFHPSLPCDNYGCILLPGEYAKGDYNTQKIAINYPPICIFFNTFLIVSLSSES